MRENYYLAESGQKVDNSLLSAPSTATPRSVPGRPSRAGESGHTKLENSGQAKNEGDAGPSAGERKKPASGVKGGKSQSEKHRRAAEARQRYELLEEERELMDNLADFWDERFDRPRRQRIPPPPWDIHKIHEPPAESGDQGDDVARVPRGRSGSR